MDKAGIEIFRFRGGMCMSIFDFYVPYRRRSLEVTCQQCHLLVKLPIKLWLSFGVGVVELISAWRSHLCLLQMPEEQAFSVLVKIMFDYGLRDLFKQNFEDLHCKFFQLERLMQASVPSRTLVSPTRRSSLLTSVCVLTGIYSRPVQPLPERGPGGSYVRLPVVPHSLHSQVPSLHGLPYHWLAAVWG